MKRVITFLLSLMHCVVNRQVEFEEYKEIMKAQFLQEAKNPYFMWKNHFVDYQTASTNQALTPETFVQSDVYLISVVL